MRGAARESKESVFQNNDISNNISGWNCKDIKWILSWMTAYYAEYYLPAVPNMLNSLPNDNKLQYEDDCE